MKKLILLTLLLSPLLQNAWALGLGKTTLHSKLGQPLEASIALVGKNIDSQQLRIGLASKEDYQKLGISRDFSHYDLQFSLAKGQQPTVNITSKKPINEPYLYFAINVKSPQGNLIKAVTLLLPAPSKNSGQSVFTP